MIYLTDKHDKVGGIMKVNMKRTSVYPLHPALKAYEDFLIPNITFKPWMLKLINALSSVGVAVDKVRNNSEKQLIKTFTFDYRSVDGKEIKATVYEPKDISKKAPALIYYHGGAFMLRDMSYIHQLARLYAIGANCRVILVHYRLSPRYSPTTILEDCYAALLEVYQRASFLGVDRTNIILGGDSAGGALATAVALMAKDRKGPKIKGQMLIYPVTDGNQTTTSARTFLKTPGWNSHMNQQMWTMYLKDYKKADWPYISPIDHPDHTYLPTTYIEVEQWDCLRDEGINYALKLMASGVWVQLNKVKGSFHGFDMYLDNPYVKRIINKRMQFLKKTFETQLEDQHV